MITDYAQFIPTVIFVCFVSNNGKKELDDYALEKANEIRINYVVKIHCQSKYTYRIFSGWFTEEE